MKDTPDGVEFDVYFPTVDYIVDNHTDAVLARLKERGVLRELPADMAATAMRVTETYGANGTGVYTIEPAQPEGAPLSEAVMDSGFVTYEDNDV